MERTIIVGAGISGVTIARILAEKGENVVVIDKRDTIGGNVYDYKDKNEIVVQKYGPHIFHTEKKEVFEFLSRFTEWTKYEHRVMAKINKKNVPVPFNYTSLFSLFPEKKAAKIRDTLNEEFGEGKKITVSELKKTNNPLIKEFAEFVYKNIFYKYSKKQWGFKPTLLGEEVINRVPIYTSYEDRYFLDTYQYMPKLGFTEMIKNILTHPKIQLQLGKDETNNLLLKNGKILYCGQEFNGKLIYTGCIDELFKYKFGVLPYRSLKFKFKTLNKENFQTSAVVNYTTTKKYTRITEFCKFTSNANKKTVICKEYPCSRTSVEQIAYYPILLEDNLQLFDKYKKEAEEYKNLYLLGRLANYKYINMDIAVLDAINLGKELEKLSSSKE